MDDPQLEVNVIFESPSSNIFIPPSIHHETLLSGASYSHFSPVPTSLLPPAPIPSDDTDCVNPATEAVGPPCALGIDEAGRGPVLGPMVYGAFYLPLPLSIPLLSKTHHFDDSKVLTPSFRSQLMEKLCTPPSRLPSQSPSSDSESLYENCGWAVEVMSARDISANMLKPFATYNLNAQAMDATISLIKRVYALGVNVREIYIDTIGQPAAYQQKLERVFPAANITVAKKADSLYPCVSAASVCAKVTRDSALGVLWSTYDSEDTDAVTRGEQMEADEEGKEKEREAGSGWGSGYPSDVRCTGWMKRNMDPIFGWGSECRFSWGTAKDMLESKGAPVAVIWAEDEDDEASKVTDFFRAEYETNGTKNDTAAKWFGTPVSAETF